jgi:hypothetical protein
MIADDGDGFERVEEWIFEAVLRAFILVLALAAAMSFVCAGAMLRVVLT